MKVGEGMVKLQTTENEDVLIVSYTIVLYSAKSEPEPGRRAASEGVPYNTQVKNRWITVSYNSANLSWTARGMS